MDTLLYYHVVFVTINKDIPRTVTTERTKDHKKDPDPSVSEISRSSFLTEIAHVCPADENFLKGD